MILSTNDFSDNFFLKYPQLILVYFYQDGCPACQNLNRILTDSNLEKSKNLYNLRDLNLGLVNLSMYPDVVQKAYRYPQRVEINSTPTLILFKDTKPKAKYSGYMNNINSILTFVRDYLDRWGGGGDEGSTKFYQPVYNKEKISSFNQRGNKRDPQIYSDDGNDFVLDNGHTFLIPYNSPWDKLKY